MLIFLTRGNNCALFQKDHLISWAIHWQSLLINQSQLTKHFDYICKFLHFCHDPWVRISSQVLPLFKERELNKGVVYWGSPKSVYAPTLWVKNVYIVGRKNKDQTRKNKNRRKERNKGQFLNILSPVNTLLPFIFLHITEDGRVLGPAPWNAEAAL